MKKIIIAIDGYSSCGKSTLAKSLASHLGYTYIDSGAMYRAVTLFLLEHSIKVEDQDRVQTALKDINIRFADNNHTLLNGRDVESEIRQMSVSNYVSEVAAVPEVRRAMVSQQQQMGEERGIVMDGRDIGTVVFPKAELKIFLTADPEIRARRRYDELAQKGQEATLEAVKANLTHRDHIDSTREDSPLRQAADAVIIDNTLLNREEQLDRAIFLARQAGA
ncbi:MAG: (d)CMP kinase [Phaeodactylibacter xiamenensis]|uniref:Cytidylate kinase n=1 Tax=Phaeodactylibacter xiamenensis TaxID=1524460 RepID=A0A098RYB7_9BACT|nr:(d)CMP kinase [Phaeodactylibacter xiamenensis]KGE85174.1 cytidylate kinase [Phaeodactylibacter xiamenensis]MCR9050958.1 (d)CMP kinase [bacterium]